MIYQFKDLEYDFQFYIMVVDDSDELLKFDRENTDFHLSERLSEVADSDAVVISDIINNNINKSIVVCFKPKFITGNYLYFLRLVSHESIHVTFRRFGDLGLVEQLENKRVFADYYDWVHTSMLDCLWEYRQKNARLGAG